MNDHTQLAIVALIALTIIVCIALYMRIDGVVLAGALAIIGAAVGVPAGIKIERNKA